MLISISIVSAFQTEIKNKVIGFASHIQITHAKINYTFENEALDFSPALLERLSTIPNITHTQVFANKAGIISAHNEIEGVVLKGISSDYDWRYMKNALLEGDILAFSDTVVSNGIIISKSLAKKLKLKKGDNFLVYFVQQPPRLRKFIIHGIYETGIEDLDKVFALCDIRHIQRLNGWKENQIGGYELFLNDLKDLEATNDIVRAGVNFNEDTKTIAQIYPQIFDWLSLLNINVRIILILMIFVASVNMITSLLVIIIEKTNMIGTLKALGSGSRSVSKVFVYHAAFLIIFGMIIGNIAGLSFIFLQSRFEIVKLDPASYYVDHVPVMFTWGRFALLNAGTFVICSLIMLLPASFISRITPLKALRFD